MSDVFDLALSGQDLVPFALEKLSGRISSDDLALVKDLLQLQYKAVQVSTGLKVSPEALQELITGVNNRICSI